MRGKFIGFIIKMVSVLRGFFYLNELKISFLMCVMLKCFLLMLLIIVINVKNNKCY